ncbi:hypothetical protein [Rhodohalobacter sp.]|uniref:hypothetical protein n=1 Tax=Rhodohalobacter sp. TaxID=1974210 RepID=UPI002ACD7EAC|nr:hypothetical protein [Rhodohalobacter sp.]
MHISQHEIFGEKMNQTIGGILSVAGIIGILFFGYQYLADSESFSVLGADVAVSTGDVVPVLISVVVFVIGLFVYRSK